MFRVGNEYHRVKDIHERYKGGRRYSGIATFANQDFVVLVSSPTGKAHGYEDTFIDGVFHYTGEGQAGDMKFTGGNRAVRDHVKESKRLFLFFQHRPNYLTYRGEAFYEDHYWAERPDTNKQPRQAIIFKLSLHTGSEVKDYSSSLSGISLSRANLDELREIALGRKGGFFNKGKKKVSESQQVRSAALRQYVRERAMGVCEGCLKSAPFITRKGPYLECHHIHFLSDGGPDLPENVAGLCANCHRRAHFSTDAHDFNTHLKEFVLSREQHLAY